MRVDMSKKRSEQVKVSDLKRGDGFYLGTELGDNNVYMVIADNDSNPQILTLPEGVLNDYEDYKNYVCTPIDLVITKD